MRDRTRVRTTMTIVVLLTLIVVAFAVGRLVVDVPNVLAGEIPEDPYESRYAEHPIPAYLHILPGVLYLLGAPFQLSRRFREGHWGLHPRLGRVLLGAGLLAGVFALVFGTLYPFGGLLEASATVVFGVWFVTALLTAYVSIRRGDATRHRRFMIRAFAVGLAVGTIRIWIGLFQGVGLLSFEDSFGAAFWLSFSLHALAAEAYLYWRPSYDGPRQPVAA